MQFICFIHFFLCFFSSVFIFWQRNFSMSVNSAAVLRLTGRGGGGGTVVGAPRGRSSSRGRGELPCEKRNDTGGGGGGGGGGHLLNILMPDFLKKLLFDINYILNVLY